ncbi:MAG: hypothetical protein NC489_19660 [Ruminococcus flavefaciens]|nr:hypothetical protein [Ruminococcus flavefaciens]
MTVSEAVIDWLKTFGGLGRIDTELMHGNVDYALVKEPVRNVMESITGDQTVTEHYTLQARMPNSTDMDSAENGVFMEALEQWVEACNDRREYPAIPNGTVTAVGVTTPFYVGRTTQDNSIYQMTISVVYEK